MKTEKIQSNLIDDIIKLSKKHNVLLMMEDIKEIQKIIAKRLNTQIEDYENEGSYLFI